MLKAPPLIPRPMILGIKNVIVGSMMKIFNMEFHHYVVITGFDLQCRYRPQNLIKFYKLELNKFFVVIALIECFALNYKVNVFYVKQKG